MKLNFARRISPCNIGYFMMTSTFWRFTLKLDMFFYQVDVFIYCIYFREKGKCYLPTTWCRSPLLNFSPTPTRPQEKNLLVAP